MRTTIQSELEDCATASSDPTQGGMGTSVLLVDAIPELRLNRRSPRNYAKVCFRTLNYNRFHCYVQSWNFEASLAGCDSLVRIHP